MLKTETRTIGEHLYEVTQLPSGRGRKLLIRLFKVLGPALGELVGAGARSLDEVDGGAVGRAVGELASRLTEEDYEHLVREMAAQSRIRSGDKLQDLTPLLDLHFAGRYDEEIRWLAFALEVNYSSFFGVLAGVGRPAATR